MTFAETEKTELKQKLTDSIPKEIVAFLNTEGGTVYIGVNDNGSVCGVDNLDESLKKIADIIDTQILPDARDFVELGTRYINQKHVIEIKIKKGENLYYIKKYGRSAQGCFVRSGSTCRSMTEEQITLTHNKYLDSRIRITEIAGDIKNPSFQYLKLLLTEKGITVNDSTFAQNFHLITKNGEYNRMADLLADKNEVSIKVVRFKGKSKADGIAMRNEYGNKCLVVAMIQAFDYCADVINATRTSIVKGIRKDQRLFDRDAFREVWFNACLHNNWADGTPPAIYIYTNRMEIISTGGLPQNLTKDDFFRGVSKPVNEELAKLFIRLDLMEQTGYGIPLVTGKYGKQIFEFLDFFLRVTIPFEFEIENEEGNNGSSDPINDPIKQDVGVNVGANEPINEPVNNFITIDKSNNYNKTEPINEPINEPVKQNVGVNDPINDPINLLDLIKEKPNANYDEYANILKVSPTTIKRRLIELKSQGIIIRVGAKKNGHWVIIKDINL